MLIFIKYLTKRVNRRAKYSSNSHAHSIVFATKTSLYRIYNPAYLTDKLYNDKEDGFALFSP